MKMKDLGQNIALYSLGLSLACYRKNTDFVQKRFQLDARAPGSRCEFLFRHRNRRTTKQHSVCVLGVKIN